ncbi:MAG: hypothetical protein BGO97_05295 [Micrococcales bacterium 70-64]|nr:HAMP domain-containing histidine kinase [Leifsonia sp.]ODU63506.1 MAG: hypothetical protein ABT06_05300 [Leifsonia sp. SCN 70-46]OJX85197.1 MAG: hypothetical protein BGO97_05295 [Micrococcales bacterium 70-64]
MPERQRGPSVRVQLTLSYAALLVLVGVAFVGVGLLVLRFIPEGNLIVVGGAFAPGRGDLIEVFVRYSVVALLALTAIGLGGGWLLAGRMLRPLDRITEAAKRARDGSLEHRIRMPGRQNELAELADTFDAMLARLQHSVDEQRRFAANASHELRTPHAIVRTMLEVARADPDGRDTDELLRRLDETNERSIALIEALLSLAAIDHYEPPSEPVDLDGLVADVVGEAHAVASASRVTIETTLAGASVIGDATLLRQLVSNLVQNAVTHNHEAGAVRIATLHSLDRVVLVVESTGDVLDPELVGTLTEPFVRAHGRTRRPGENGTGLGLAIVSSIVRAHRGTLELDGPATGGLVVRVALPAQVSPMYPDSRTEPQQPVG